MPPDNRPAAGRQPEYAQSYHRDDIAPYADYSRDYQDIYGDDDSARFLNTVPDEREMRELDPADRTEIHSALLEAVAEADNPETLARDIAEHIMGEVAAPAWTEAYAQSLRHGETAANLEQIYHYGVSHPQPDDIRQLRHRNEAARESYHAAVAATLWQDTRKAASGNPAATAMIQTAQDRSRELLNEIPDGDAEAYRHSIDHSRQYAAYLADHIARPAPFFDGCPTPEPPTELTRQNVEYFMDDALDNLSAWKFDQDRAGNPLTEMQAAHLATVALLNAELYQANIQWQDTLELAHEMESRPDLYGTRSHARDVEFARQDTANALAAFAYALDPSNASTEPVLQG